MIIKNGYVIDPANKKEGVFDIRIKGSKIKEVSKKISAKENNIIDAKGKFVFPGLIDMHVHLREPGREDIETVFSGTRAALFGGMTSVCSMPNTQPPIDDRDTVRRLNDIIKRDAATNTFVIGAITKGRMGRELADLKGMKEEGAAAFTDDGSSIQDKSVMQSALKKAREKNLLLISHCENSSVSKKGVVNEGIVATKLGLRAIPKRAEYEFVARDIKLAEKTKARIHIAHVSCKESVEIIRQAKRDDIAVTAETAPHYFSLKDSCCETYDTRTKMNPPLRSAEDVEAIIRGLADGTIDAIASDHAPHGKHEKETVFEEAAFGIIGLETSLTLAIANLISGDKISWARLVELLSVNPAKILGLKNKGKLSSGCDADITILDKEREWVYSKEKIQSKSKNSPFIDWQFKGKVTDVIVGGRHVFKDGRVS